MFTPLKDFADKELRSAYCVGLNYTVRDHVPSAEVPGNKFVKAEDTLLGKKLKQWLEAGLVRLGAADGSPASESRVKGTGTVI